MYAPPCGEMRNDGEFRNLSASCVYVINGSFDGNLRAARVRRIQLADFRSPDRVLAKPAMEAKERRILEKVRANGGHPHGQRAYGGHLEVHK
jgi:hypothetical protein